jgi:methylated-DNA-[protein]-cysteine S-methyltransferase
MQAVGYTLFDTAIGRCAIAWSERGVVSIRLPEGDDARMRARVTRHQSDLAESEPPPAIREAIKLIQALLRGEKVEFSAVAVDLDAVEEFNRRVYDIAREIPAGETMTYGEIATRIGDLQLSRAVGQALGQNPVPVIVPCHRVLGADRKPGGFSAPGGVNTKLKILSIERAHIGGTRDLFDLV